MWNAGSCQAGPVQVPTVRLHHRLIAREPGLLSRLRDLVQRTGGSFAGWKQQRDGEVREGVQSVKKIYLAIPYTGQEVMAFATVTWVAGHLMSQGSAVFSPITMGVPIERSDLPTPKDGHGWWLERDLTFIRDWADEVCVVQLGDVDHAPGVQEEIRFARALGKPVTYFRPPEIDLAYPGTVPGAQRSEAPLYVKPLHLLSLGRKYQACHARCNG